LVTSKKVTFYKNYAFLHCYRIILHQGHTDKTDNVQLL